MKKAPPMANRGNAARLSSHAGAGGSKWSPPAGACKDAHIPTQSGAGGSKCFPTVGAFEDGHIPVRSGHPTNNAMSGDTGPVKSSGVGGGSTPGSVAANELTSPSQLSPTGLCSVPFIYQFSPFFVTHFFLLIYIIPTLFLYFRPLKLFQLLLLNQKGGRLARLQVVQFLPEQGHTLQLLQHTLMAVKPNDLGFLITQRFVNDTELVYFTCSSYSHLLFSYVCRHYFSLFLCV
jgi:hypothetical protein